MLVHENSLVDVELLSYWSCTCCTGLVGFRAGWLNVLCERRPYRNGMEGVSFWMFMARVVGEEGRKRMNSRVQLTSIVHAVENIVTKASMLAEFFFALAMLWWEGLRALKIDISS